LFCFVLVLVLVLRGEERRKEGGEEKRRIREGVKILSFIYIYILKTSLCTHSRKEHSWGMW
jgi:hypothetical protein